MLPLLLALTACEPPLPDLAGADDQLESPSVSHDVPQAEPADLSLAGALSVSGGDGDWTLQIADPSLDPVPTLTVHSPGRADLSTLSGAQVQALLPGDWFAEHYSLLLTDAQGPLYVLDMGLHAEQANAAFGEGFVSHGEVVGAEEDETWSTWYTRVVFQTDDGAVQLLPGEVQEIRVGGLRYRAVAIAAWTREPRADAALPGCPVAEELLAYELIRVEQEVEADLVERPQGLAPATAGCL
ncbi:hypothetical protein L6R53_26765 [Myxococcota bacterium]|nr:hypothetical protein [Myxococcota bacterium]